LFISEGSKNILLVTTVVSFCFLFPIENSFAQSFPKASPESVGLSAERLNRVDALFESYMADDRMAGAVIAIARDGKLAHFQTIGGMDMQDTQPMRGDAIFRMASMTKPITSTAVLMLYEEGHFQLEDPVSWYIPELAGMTAESEEDGPNREMSIRDLLMHTSGLPGNGQDPEHNEIWRNLDLTLQEQVAELGQQSLAYSPGTDWRYSEATNILGYFIEVLSGQPFNVFLSERIFGPLGMVDTDFFVPQYKAHRLPAVYGGTREGVTEELWVEPRESELRMPKAPRGTGGLFSTAHDYLRFSQMLLNGGELDGVRLLSPKTVELMVTDHLPSHMNLPGDYGNPLCRIIEVGICQVTNNTIDSLGGYGFGLGVRVRTSLSESQFLGSVGEYGWAGAYGTYFFIDPEEDLVAMFLVQLRSSGFFPIFRQFNNVVYQSIVN
jgi:CubicO group peptidase (beta-lactamase class C family)